MTATRKVPFILNVILYWNSNFKTDPINYCDLLKKKTILNFLASFNYHSTRVHATFNYFKLELELLKLHNLKLPKFIMGISPLFLFNYISVPDFAAKLALARCYVKYVAFRNCKSTLCIQLCFKTSSTLFILFYYRFLLVYIEFIFIWNCYYLF